MCARTADGREDLNPDRNVDAFTFVVATQEVAEVTDFAGPLRQLLATADGSRVIARGDGAWHVIDRGADPGRRILAAAPEGPSWLSDDGGLLLDRPELPVLRGPEGESIGRSSLRQVPVDGGAPTVIRRLAVPGVPRLARDGTTVVFDAVDDLDGSNSDGSSEVWVHDVHTGVAEALTETGGHRSIDPSPSADGRLVAFASDADLDPDHPEGNTDESTEIFLADVDAGTFEQLTAGHDGDSVGPALAASGAAVGFVSDADLTGENAEHLPEVFHLDLTTDVLTQVTTGARGGTSHPASSGVVLSADGQHLAFASNVRSGHPYRTQRYTWSVGDLEVQQQGINTTLDHPWPVIRDDGTMVLRPGPAPRSVALDRSTGALDLVTCPTFVDVPPGHPFEHDVAWMAAEGLADGYADGTFRPSATVSRQAMAAFLFRLAGSPPPSGPLIRPKDVSPSHPFVEEIMWAVRWGITRSYADGTFRPGAPVSRQAAVAFLHRFVHHPDEPPGTTTFSDVSSRHPFFREIDWAVAEGITAGYADGTFRPLAPMTRQATAAFLHRTPDRYR